MAQATILSVAGTLLEGLFAEVIPITLFWFIPWAMFWIMCLVIVIATSTLAVDIHYRLITGDFEATFFKAFERSVAHSLSVLASGFVTAVGFLITCLDVSHRAYESPGYNTSSCHPNDISADKVISGGQTGMRRDTASKVPGFNPAKISSQRQVAEHIAITTSGPYTDELPSERLMRDWQTVIASSDNETELRLQHDSLMRWLKRETAELRRRIDEANGN
ncbi:hypothetical protein LTR27_003531 [Elasticomyces elasticus]|nr:hypothetical protein LTR27_003531 [Elasticomyces elasticus]